MNFIKKTLLLLAQIFGITMLMPLIALVTIYSNSNRPLLIMTMLGVLLLATIVFTGYFLLFGL